MSNGKTILMLPLKGISGIDIDGQPFYGEEEDKILFDTLKDNINRNVVEIVEMDYDINDIHFAHEAAQKLIDLIEN